MDNNFVYTEETAVSFASDEIKEAFCTVECFATHGGIGSDCCKRCGKHTFDEQFDALMKLRDYIYGEDDLDFKLVKEEDFGNGQVELTFDCKDSTIKELEKIYGTKDFEKLLEKDFNKKLKEEIEKDKAWKKK